MRTSEELTCAKVDSAPMITTDMTEGFRHSAIRDPACYDGAIACRQPTGVGWTDLSRHEFVQVKYPYDIAASRERGPSSASPEAGTANRGLLRASADRPQIGDGLVEMSKRTSGRFSSSVMSMTPDLRAELQLASFRFTSPTAAFWQRRQEWLTRRAR